MPSPFALALPGRNSAFRGFQNLPRSTFHQGPKTLRAALALCQRFARSNIAFRRFPHLHQANFTRTRNPPVHLSPFAPALPGRNSAFREGFKTCAKHVPPGPQTLPGSFNPLPALCHRPLPLPCQVEILHLEGFKTCAEHVPPGPQNPPCSVSPLPALLPGRILHLDGFHACARHVSVGHETLLCTFRPLPLPCQVGILHLRGFSKPARSTFHQGPKPFRATLAHLASALPSPLALALPGRNTAFRGFQNLREARSTRAPKPSVQL